MVLADTSVWIGHFRGSESALAPLLSEGQVLVHPFIIGELSLGHLRHRAQILQDLQRLPQITLATDSETLAWVEKRKLFGKGIGWMDAHLLLSCLLHGASLWTYDKGLLSAARSTGAGIHLGR